ncbi:MAG: hypothetical protein ACKVQA_06220 [Burkholderiales bacterium]
MKSDTLLRNIVIGQFLAGAALACGPASVSIAADDAFVCMEETQEKCDYENRNMALFIKGRDAFDRGREIGDFREARGYALELIERGDIGHGGALMKFIYLQLGLGVHKNLVEAYRWVAADIAAGATYKRLNLEHILDRLAQKMTPGQLSEAKR